MTEEERHVLSHETAEQEITDVLWDIFADSERVCRAEVLIKLLYAEFMAMDDDQDVSEVTQAMARMIMSRAHTDLTMFSDVAGNA
jgi:hypothetical protein